MYAVHEYTPHRRTTQKGPYGHHLQPHQSRVLRYRRHAAHESTRCPRAPWRRSAPCASAACSLACAPGATPRDRGHVRALGHRRLVDVMVGCGGAEVIDRAHDINELSYPLPGETIARICEHMADLPATPSAPETACSTCPRATRASSTCRASMACLFRWSILPSFYASRSPR